jgi:beta-lactamase class D
MKTILLKYAILLFLLAVFGGCSVQPSKDSQPDYRPFFQEYGVDGCFLLYNPQTDFYQIYNSHRCEEGFLPASTFKILNALIGLETGVITDENMVIPWDQTVRSEEAWNRDHTLASAIHYSAVPYFQEMARRIGPVRMNEYVEDSDYGRMVITPETIDKFWLWGESRITPWEQMNFLHHFYTNRLPFSQTNIDLVKRLIILEQNEQWTLYGKTGMTIQDGKTIGWLVGYLEQDGKVWLYVCNAGTENSNTENLKASRRGVTDKVFKSMGLMTK